VNQACCLDTSLTHVTTSTCGGLCVTETHFVAYIRGGWQSVNGYHLAVLVKYLAPFWCTNSISNVVISLALNGALFWYTVWVVTFGTQRFSI